MDASVQQKPIEEVSEVFSTGDLTSSWLRQFVNIYIYMK